MKSVSNAESRMPMTTALDGVEEFEFDKCIGFQKVKESLKSTNIYEILKDSRKLLLLTFRVEDDFNELNTIQSYELSNLCKGKAIIIVFLSEDGKKFSIHWKTVENHHFFTFSYNNEELIGANKKLKNFLTDFLVKYLQEGYDGLAMNYRRQNELCTVEIYDFADYRNYNLLFLGVESGDEEIVEILIKSGIPSSLDDEGVTVQSLAWSKNHQNIILKLLQSNFQFPITFDENYVIGGLKEFCDMTKKLHNAIEAGQIKTVEEIVIQNSHLCYFYNIYNESAAKTALLHGKLDIYEFLLANEVFFGPQENTSEVLDDLDPIIQKNIRELHFKYTLEIRENHIGNLIAHTTIVHDTSNVKTKIDRIQHAYITLNKNPILKPIMKIVSASKDTRIVFDFNRESVKFMDPTNQENSQAVFYMSGRMFIGAKQLLDPATEHETFGNLIHEFCHYAVALTFKNNAKPYLKNDHQTMQEFEEISEICRSNSEVEDVIAMVYNCYIEDDFHAELIVRVAHLHALYVNDLERLKFCQEVFSRLFDFFEFKIIPLIENALVEIEKRDERELERRGQKISKLKKCFCGFGILSAAAIMFVVFILYTPTYNFKDLTERERNIVMNSLTYYKNVQVKLYDIFPGNSTVLEQMSSQHISNILNGKNLNFSDPHLGYLEEWIFFNWENLTENLKFKILESNISFQNESVRISDLNITELSKNALTPMQIKQIFNGIHLNIGKMASNKTKFYIERKFIFDDANFAYVIYQRSEKLNNVSYLVGYKEFPNFASNLDMWEKAGLLNGYSLINGSIKDIYRLFQNVNFGQYVETIKEVSRKRITDKNRFYNDLQTDVFSFLHKNFDDVLQIALTEKIFILSSEAGAGKTVTFEQFTIKIKKKLPNRWISYVDLKNNIQYYKNEESLKNIPNLLKEILNLNSGNDFETRIFEELYESGNVIFLWNGFDEISPSYNQFVLNILTHIYKNTNNIQFVCTRPYYSIQLRDSFQTKPFPLLPLSNHQKKELLWKFYESREINMEKIPKLIEKVQKTITNLKSGGVTSESFEVSRDFNTPLMLILAAEIHLDNSSSSKENFYEIYRKFVERKVSIWQNEPSAAQYITKIVSRNLNVPGIHQKYALPLELYERLHIIIVVNLKKLKIFRRLYSKLPNEEISRLGMLYINSEYRYEFAHKTFAEFFTAQYFIDNIYSTDEDLNPDEAFLRLELFFFVAQNYGRNQLMVTEFMESFLETKNTSDSRSFDPATSELLRTTFKKFLFDLANPEFPKILKFILNFFKRDHGVLLELLNVNDDETLYTATFNPNYFIRLVNPEEIKEIVMNYLSREEFQQFIIGRNQKGKILLGMLVLAYRGKPKIHHEFSVDEYLKLELSPWEFIDEISKNLTKAEQKELFLTAISPNCYGLSENFLEQKLTKLWKSFQGLLTKIELKTAIGNTIDRVIRKYPEPNAFQAVANFIPFLLIKAEELLNDTEIFEMISDSKILHIATYNPLALDILWNFVEKHMNLEQQKHILQQDDERKYYRKDGYFEEDFNTPMKIIHLSFMRDYDEVMYDKILNIYWKLFTKVEIQNILKSCPEFLVQFVWHTHGKTYKSKVIIPYLAKIFEDDGKSYNDFLMQKIKPTDLTVFDYFHEILPVSFSQDLKYLSDLNNEINKKVIEV